MEVPPTGSKEKFSWRGGEIELILEHIKVYTATCHFEGLHQEGIRAKYDKIRELFIKRYPTADTEAVEVDFQERIVSKI